MVIDRSMRHWSSVVIGDLRPGDLLATNVFSRNDVKVPMLLISREPSTDSPDFFEVVFLLPMGIYRLWLKELDPISMYGFEECVLSEGH